MTAEVAILNKTAVALATDSMVTISTGSQRQKVFDSADKLFELSSEQPIGVMLYNGMSFMEMPLAPLIKDFRKLGKKFDSIADITNAFLLYLNDEGKASPQSVLDRCEKSAVHGALTQLRQKFQNGLMGVVLKAPSSATVDDLLSEYLTQLIAEAAKQYAALDNPNAKFVGLNIAPKFTQRLRELYLEQIKELFPQISDENRDSLVEFCGQVMKSRVLSTGRTGLVFAGFGETEKFPTLMSVEIDGIVAGHLKYTETNFVDIDRQGKCAAVLPFAQTEMVDRFVYGIDGTVMSRVEKSCNTGLESFAKSIIDATNLSDTKKNVLHKASEAAKNVFLHELKTATLEKMRAASVSNIESMVEFMPKPEMAKMAEALIELTSIKRKVSRGLETVGGPIDVAVISREEGFVWVKRKHYFSVDRNLRYNQRLLRGGM